MCWEWHLKQSLPGPERSDGADILQCEREAKAAFNASADVELADFEAQTVAMRIIANLGD